MQSHTISQTHMMFDDRTGSDRHVVTDLRELADEHVMPRLEASPDRDAAIDDSVAPDGRGNAEHQRLVGTVDADNAEGPDVDAVTEAALRPDHARGMDHASSTGAPLPVIDSSMAARTRTTSTPCGPSANGGSPLAHASANAASSTSRGSRMWRCGMMMSPARVRHWKSPIDSYAPKPPSERATPASTSQSF